MFRVWNRLHLGLLICLSSMLFAVSLAQAQASDVQVIVHPSSNLSAMTVEQVRRIFSMRQTVWASQVPIKVYVLDSQHEIHQQFCTQTLGLFPYQLDRVWNKLIYSGLGEEPTKVRTVAEMLERVSTQPGAIGYLNNQSINGDVKIVKIQKE